MGNRVRKFGKDRIEQLLREPSVLPKPNPQPSNYQLFFNDILSTRSLDVFMYALQIARISGRKSVSRTDLNMAEKKYDLKQ